MHFWAAAQCPEPYIKIQSTLNMAACCAGDTGGIIQDMVANFTSPAIQALLGTDEDGFRGLEALPSNVRLRA